MHINKYCQGNVFELEKEDWCNQVDVTAPYRHSEVSTCPGGVFYSGVEKHSNFIFPCGTVKGRKKVSTPPQAHLYFIL